MVLYIINWTNTIIKLNPKQKVIEQEHFYNVLAITKDEYRRKYLRQFKNDYLTEIRVRTEDEVYDILLVFIEEIWKMLSKRHSSSPKKMLQSYVVV
jgi:hypothetical protein